MRFHMHNVACPEFVVDEKSFIGVIQALWDSGMPGLRPPGFDQGPMREFNYFTQDVRGYCRVSVSQRMIDDGVRLAGPDGWIMIKPSATAWSKMSERFSR